MNALKLPKLKIMVVGDPILDVYHYGTTSRLSPEAPVPVFVEHATETRRGGAANVANQLRALGVEVQTVFPETGQQSEKHRYMVGAHQLLRVDRDVIQPVDVPDIIDCDAVILSDYAKGALTFDVCQDIMATARCPVVVDPKGDDFEKYVGCEVICPNELEAKNKQIDVFNTVLYKQGAKGLTLVTGESRIHLPAKARKVFDVTGAGDTVVAVFTTWLAAGESMSTAAAVSNVAAGWVVEQPGTAVISADTLAQLLGRL